MRSNIVLVGYRGTGKSSVGKILGQKMKREVISLDESIVKSAGMSIPELVEEHGWNYFRDLESEVIRKIYRRQGIIIDAGGGVVIRPENMSDLKQGGVCFLLTATIATIAARIGGDVSRPSLTGKSIIEEIATVLEKRNPMYQAAAEFTVTTDEKTPEEIAAEVQKIFLENLLTGR